MKGDVSILLSFVVLFSIAGDDQGQKRGVDQMEKIENKLRELRAELDKADQRDKDADQRVTSAESKVQELEDKKASKDDIDRATRRHDVALDTLETAAIALKDLQSRIALLTKQLNEMDSTSFSGAFSLTISLFLCCWGFSFSCGYAHYRTFLFAAISDRDLSSSISLLFTPKIE